MGRKSTRRKSHPQIDVETVTKSYYIRDRDKGVSYKEISDSESDSDNRHWDSSKDMHVRSTKRRKPTSNPPKELEIDKLVTRGVKTTSHTLNAVETGNTSSAQKTLESKRLEPSVDLIVGQGKNHKQGVNSTLCTERTIEAKNMDSIVDLTAENTKSCTPTAAETDMVHLDETLTIRSTRDHRQGGGSNKKRECGAERGGGVTRCGVWGICNRTSQRSLEGEQNIETSDSGQSLTMEKGLSSNERQFVGVERGSPSPPPELERVRLSCKKTILSWLIDCNLIDVGRKVRYMHDINKIRAMSGIITRDGILCSCCQKEISVSTFEKHNGSDLNKPYENIYCLFPESLEKGTPLKTLLVTAWERRTERNRRKFLFMPKENAADKNDEVCSICGDGGDLIRCAKCPSMYHPFCVNIERVPYMYWSCPYCICKYCGFDGNSKDFSTCYQCDKKFHWNCFLKHFEKDFSKETLDLRCTRLYCGPDCREIYEKLEGSLGTRNGIFANYAWRVVRQTDITPMMVDDTNLNMENSIENNAKVAVVWMLMNEAFESIKDRCTGTNVVQSTVYSRGSDLNRINFSRFYNFVMEKDDEIIAAASIRIHGRKIAEMPFIATDGVYRGQGYCRSLMREIESFLCSLKVENLIIPSILDTTGMWKQKFGFNVVNKELKRIVSSTNILMFPHAIRLWKNLFKGIPDGGCGEDSGHNQSDIQNGPGPQVTQVERPLQPEILSGLKPQPMDAERPLQIDIQSGPKSQLLQEKMSLQINILNGPELQPEHVVQVQRPLQTGTRNGPEPPPVEAERPLQIDVQSGPESQLLQEKMSLQTDILNGPELQQEHVVQVERPLQTGTRNGPEPPPVETERPLQIDIQSGPESQLLQEKRSLQTDILNGPELQPEHVVRVERPPQTGTRNGPEPPSVETERPLQIDIQSSPESQLLQEKRSLQTDILNGPEAQLEHVAQVDRPLQIGTWNGPVPQSAQAAPVERLLQTGIQSRPDPRQKLEKLQIDLNEFPPEEDE